MDLRRFTLIVLGIAGAAALRGAAIQTYPLDERLVYTVRIARDEPTTCLFPAALTALEGGNVSVQATDAPPVLLSYQPGAAFFSVRALRDDAKAAINVVFRGKVFVLTFQTDAVADRAVSFVDEADFGVARKGVTLAPERLRALIDRAKRHELIARQYPALTQTVERLTPGTLTRYPGFVVTLAEVFRFAAEDTLVLRAEIENTTDAALRFDPSGLAVRVGPTIYPAALAEAAGGVAPRGRSTCWIAITVNADGSAANLSAHNTFFVLVPRLP